MRYLCSDHFSSLKPAVDGGLLSLKPLWGFLLQTGVSGLSVWCTALNIPFTRASISHALCFILCLSLITANAILQKLFLLHVFIILCQFMRVWVKTGSPCLCTFIIVYTPNTSSHGKPGCAVDLPSEHVGCISPCHHYQDQMTINNCCLLMFQTALCQTRGAACFFKV